MTGPGRITRAHDYARWFRNGIKDEDLAGAVSPGEPRPYQGDVERRHTASVKPNNDAGGKAWL
jgi:hypothetical protein